MSLKYWVTVLAGSIAGWNACCRNSELCIWSNVFTLDVKFRGGRVIAPMHLCMSKELTVRGGCVLSRELAHGKRGLCALNVSCLLSLWEQWVARFQVEANECNLFMMLMRNYLKKFQNWKSARRAELKEVYPWRNSEEQVFMHECKLVELWPR